MPNILFDSAMQTLAAGLDGLALRRDVISRNIANVDTPGYHAQTVLFEDTLQKAQSGQQAMAMEVTHAAHLAVPSQTSLMRVEARTGGSARADGNNVDVDVELAQMSETDVRYQALSTLISKKLALLKTIAQSR